MIAPPSPADFGFYSNYISKAPKIDLIQAMTDNWETLESFVNSLTDDQLELRYQPGKWSIKEVLLHLIDAERNFCYRIMRLSRGDQAQLPVFNVDDFIANAHVDERSRESITRELYLLRQSTIAMFQGMPPVMLDRTGPARDVIISVRALGFAIVGHVAHHMDIIKERYLGT